MRTITIPTRAKTINALLKKARRRSVVLETTDGQRYVLTSVSNWEGFDVGGSRDFGEEVKRTAQNKRLMKFLAERRKTSKGKSKSLEEVEKELGLA
jgi:hypothetical protein